MSAWEWGRNPHRQRLKSLGVLGAALIINFGVLPTAADSGKLPLVDTHIHYSHDARLLLSVEKAISILRSADLKLAFVSSSGDEGTQMLYEAAPDLVVPVLRPYRRRGELQTWVHDNTVPEMLEQRISKYQYAGIGEFHAFGADIDLPVLRRLIDIARKNKLFLHAHSDAAAIEKIFAQDPGARVLWAHGGFESREVIAEMLGRHDNLWCDLAFRYEHESGGVVDSQWREIFLEYPDRFTLGADSYSPERWFYVKEYADSSRKWLADLPGEVARKIAHDNARDLVRYAGFEIRSP